MKVTQEDREAAANFCEVMGHHRVGVDDTDFPRKVREGKRDRYVYVKAFAAHREAAEARVVEWLRTSHIGAVLPGIADAVARGDHLKG